MIITTERQSAEEKISFIKEAIKNSKVDYLLSESPYTVSIQLKKKFLKDFSPKLTGSHGVSTPSLKASSPSFIPNSVDISSLSEVNDSGFGNLSIPKFDYSVNNEKGEFILKTENNELKQKLTELQNEINNKDIKIAQLQSNLKSASEKNSQIKTDFNTRNEQLKKKNKELDKQKTIYEKVKLEKEDLNNNFKNKVSNLESKVKDLERKLATKEEERRLQKAKSKNLEAKKSKNKDTQTDPNNKYNSTQTTRSTSNETKDIGTSPLFTKIPIFGEPTHDVTCFCLCHEDDNGKNSCEVQLFQYTTDPEAALDSLYYWEDYEYLTDEEETNKEDNYSETWKPKSALERLINFKDNIDDETILKETVKEALEKMFVRKGRHRRNTL